MNGARLASIEDAEAMSFVHARTWKSAYTQFITAEHLDSITDEGWVPLFTRAFKNNLHQAAVFELDGEITGTVTFGLGRKINTCNYDNINGTDKGNLNCEENRTANCSEEGEIISLYVLPQYWSKKQGFELTKFAIEHLKKQGYESCYLWVIKDNERAVNFYRKFGFNSTGEIISVMVGGKAVIEEKYRIHFY